MYQIKYGAGYEIRVIGKGENGRCEVAKATSGQDQTLYSGTFAECQRWLSDRGVNALDRPAPELPRDVDGSGE